MRTSKGVPERLKELSFRSTLLVEQLVSFFIEAILEGKLKGGEQLVENELQKHLGVSRSPLREAFRELEKRGLVVITPRKGTYVRTMTRKDLEDNIPVRAVLEGLPVRMACGESARRNWARPEMRSKGCASARARGTSAPTGKNT